MKSDLDEKYVGRIAKQNMIKTGFIDPGGNPDEAAFNFARSDVSQRIIYITDQIFWKLNEKEKITFYSIRKDIAILHGINHFDLLGCERNNYGRNEIESMKREYGIPIFGVNTTGKITDEDKQKSGESMDKEAIIKTVNAWRVNAIIDPDNLEKLGQIRFPPKKKRTPGLHKLITQIDSFVRVDPNTLGSLARPKFGAEGTQHDDGVMSMLGNIHVILTKLMMMSYSRRTIASKKYGVQSNRMSSNHNNSNNGINDRMPQLTGRTIAQVGNNVASQQPR